MTNKLSGKRKRGTLLILIGLLLIVAALFLALYNMWDEARVDEVKVVILEQLEPKAVENIEEQELPDYKKYPDMEMPVKEIDGKSYIGILEIPYLNLKLPVISEWSYPNLKTAPCRYEGSAYQNNLIIAAHNYQSHFGNLKSLLQEEQILFTDMDGNVFEYRVLEMEIIEPTDIERMESGEWDLTLLRVPTEDVTE